MKPLNRFKINFTGSNFTMAVIIRGHSDARRFDGNLQTWLQILISSFDELISDEALAKNMRNLLLNAFRKTEHFPALK